MSTVQGSSSSSSSSSHSSLQEERKAEEEEEEEQCNASFSRSSLESEETPKTCQQGLRDRLKSFIEKIKKKRKLKKGSLFPGDPKYRATSRDRFISSFLKSLRRFTGLSFLVGVFLLLSFDHFNRELTVEEHGFSHGVHHATFVDDSLFYQLRNQLQEASLLHSSSSSLSEDEEEQEQGEEKEELVEDNEEEEEDREISRDSLPLLQPSSYPFLFLPSRHLFFSSCSDAKDEEEEAQDFLRLFGSSPRERTRKKKSKSFSSFPSPPPLPPPFLCTLASFLKSHGVHEVYIQPFYVSEDDPEKAVSSQQTSSEQQGDWSYNLIAISRSSRGDSRDSLAFFFSTNYSSLSLPSSSSPPVYPSGGAGSLLAVLGSLAVFLQNEAPWLSRDVIFILSDSKLPYKAGIRAWMSAYMRSSSYFPRRGLLRMAVGIEVPSSSSSPSFSSSTAASAEGGQELLASSQGEREEGFSYLSLDIEGSDGRLPNQDLVNVVLAEANRGGVTVKLRNVSSTK